MGSKGTGQVGGPGGEGGGPGAAPGERIIPGSRRPDGTYRKEIRVRAGYVPQDEVDKYMARGTRPKSDGNDLPPGMDPEFAAAQIAAKKKAAAKNQKRKEKKAASSTPVKASSSHSGSTDPATAAGSPAAVAAAADAVARVSLGGSQPSAVAQQGTAAAVAAAPSGEKGACGEGQGDAAVDVQKQLRALRKKIRQAEELQAKVSSRGSGATAEEQEKMNRLPDWQGQVQELEAKLQA